VIGSYTSTPQRTGRVAGWWYSYHVNRSERQDVDEESQTKSRESCSYGDLTRPAMTACLRKEHILMWSILMAIRDAHMWRFGLTAVIESCFARKSRECSCYREFRTRVSC